MDGITIVASQCEACEEQPMFIDPANCAQCLSGNKPVDSEPVETIENERLSTASLRLTA